MTRSMRSGFSRSSRHTSSSRTTSFSRASRRARSTSTPRLRSVQLLPALPCSVESGRLIAIPVTAAVQAFLGTYIRRYEVIDHPRAGLVGEQRPSAEPTDEVTDAAVAEDAKEISASGGAADKSPVDDYFSSNTRSSGSVVRRTLLCRESTRTTVSKDVNCSVDRTNTRSSSRSR